MRQVFNFPSVPWRDPPLLVQLTSETCGGVLGYPIFEFTSSGLTHSFGGSQGAITAVTMALSLNPRTRVGYLVPQGPRLSKPVGPNPGSSWTSGAYWGGESFGEVEIEWPQDSDPGDGSSVHDNKGRITFRAIDAAGIIRFEHSIPFGFLAPWPTAFHPSNGLRKATTDETVACAAANLSSGLSPACAAVLAACDGHRGVDLGDAMQRGHSVSIHAFKAVMGAAAAVALLGTPAAMTWLFVAASSGRRWRLPLFISIAMGVYSALWWQHIVVPFEE